VRDVISIIQFLLTRMVGDLTEIEGDGRDGIARAQGCQVNPRISLVEI
jgi:hypothetical protein